MNKKSKKIIETAIRQEVNQQMVNEGPIDAMKSAAASAKGVGGGLAKMGRGIGTNYRLGQIGSQLDQFAKKTQDAWGMHKQKIEKAANRIANSKDPEFKELGNEILSQLDTADEEMKQAIQSVQQGVSRTMSRQAQKGDKEQKAQPQQQQGPLSPQQGTQQQDPSQRYSQYLKDMEAEQGQHEPLKGPQQQQFSTRRAQQKPELSNFSGQVQQAGKQALQRLEKGK